MHKHDFECGTCFNLLYDKSFRGFDKNVITNVRNETHAIITRNVWKTRVIFIKNKKIIIKRNTKT